MGVEPDVEVAYQDRKDSVAHIPFMNYNIGHHCPQVNLFPPFQCRRKGDEGIPGTHIQSNAKNLNIE